MNLRQSTSVVIPFGPFLDKADGVTLKTTLVSALDNATTGIMVSKNGGTLAVRHATVTASAYDAYGIYKVTLDTTDTGTLGAIRVIYADATTCLPVWQDFQVITQNEWDSQCAAAVRNVTATTVTDKTGYSLAVTPPTVAQIRTEMDTNSTKLDVAVSTRSTYAGTDTAGTTTLLTRIPGNVQPQTGDAYARLGPPLTASVSADIAAVKADTSATRTDYTTARAAKLDNIDVAVSTRTKPADTQAAVTVTGSVTGSVGSVTGNVAGSVASVIADVGITQAAADKIFGSSGASLTELSVGQPPATPRPDQALMLLYMALRNTLTTSATTKQIRNNAESTIAKKALSDDGTTYTETKMVAGP